MVAKKKTECGGWSPQFGLRKNLDEGAGGLASGDESAEGNEMSRSNLRSDPACRAFSWRAAVFVVLALWSCAPPLPAEEGGLALSGPGWLQANGTSDQFEVSWWTRPGFNYLLESSPDSVNWEQTWIIEQGSGAAVLHSFPFTDDRRFFRVEESIDSSAEAFLVLPVQDSTVTLDEGVCFSFDLGVFPALPAKIHLYQRSVGGAETWHLIGTISDFGEDGSLRFVRGSSIWIAREVGSYEVQAAVVDLDGAVLATATRSLTVTGGNGPSVILVSGPSSPSATALVPLFETDLSGSVEVLQRVEFYDNGVLIGADDELPFGDVVEDGNGEIYALLRGTHQITAKAYDVEGGIGETVLPLEVVVTGGNARPTLLIDSPLNGVSVTQGEDLIIEVTLADDDGEADLLRVDALNITNSQGASDLSLPFGPLTIDTTDWEPGSHRLRVSTRDLGGAESYPQFLTVYIQDPAAPDFAGSLAAVIADPMTAAPSNAAFTGVEASSAEFQDGLASGLQLDSGILLTSGLASLWNGGDLRENTDERLAVRLFNNFEEPGDPVLEQLVDGNKTFDAAVLEFDVFCTHGQLEIDFQFGSEEYDQWVSSFNDAFLISVDGVPASLLPDCSDIVAVSSVNAVFSSNLHLYLDDDDDIAPTVASGSEAVQVEYDGMTIRLRIHAFVTPNQNHRVRLVVVDVNDDLLDSALIVSGVRTVPPRQ